ncbi:MAG: hypothetical protein H6868_01595 [Rhodospirillales bacterium]|nr:hypothetical protein [Rhodospirillales bacterium]
MENVLSIFKNKTAADSLDRQAQSVWVAQGYDFDLWPDVIEKIYNDRIFYAFRLAAFPRGMNEKDLRTVIGGIVALEMTPESDENLRNNLSRACMEILRPVIENKHVNNIDILGTPSHVSVIFSQLVDSLRSVTSQYKNPERSHPTNLPHRPGR